jgi:transposase
VVMPNQVAPSPAASGPGTEEGRRPTIVPGPLAASPEFSHRPRRRTFTVEDKLRILAETDQAVESRGIGAILRREGLYSSILTDWRRQRAAGAYGALSPAHRGPKPLLSNPLAAELASAKRENARLQWRLERAETIIELQKKVAALLGIAPLASDGEP